MKNRNAIFFTLKLDSQNNTDYYCMLLTALESIYKYSNNITYDIIVYYDFNNLNINTLNINSYSLLNFPDIILINKPWTESIYYDNIPNPNYFYKWLCLEHIIHNYTYEKIIYLDCDIYCLDNIDKIFKNYDKEFYGMYEGYDELKLKLIGTPYAMCSGQFIFQRHILLNIPQLFQQVINKSKYLCDNAERLLDNHPNVTWIKTLMEQYAGHAVLLDNNIPITPINLTDIRFGIGTCDIDITEDQSFIKDATTKIIHYTRKNAAIFVDQKYRNSNLQQEFNSQVINNKLQRHLWE